MAAKRWRPRRKLARLARSIAWTMRNARNGARIRHELLAGTEAIGDLARYERRFTSQNGEDGVLAALFAVLGRGAGSFVEFGAGRRCNALRLACRDGWTGLWMDPGGAWPDAPLPVHREFVTAENVEALFDRYAVPERPDLLSLDIDGNDWWVWRAIRSRRPRVVVIEQNSALGATASLTIPYDPAFRWSGSDYFGASLLALERLGRAKGYALVGSESSGTNAFFVDRELLGSRLSEISVASAWRAPRLSAGARWPAEDRPRVEVGADGEPIIA